MLLGLLAIITGITLIAAGLIFVIICLAKAEVPAPVAIFTWLLGRWSK
ncbi:MAG: hypothetical protein J6Y02_16360 [Pseudobutyrivibrio sp.]|nr:hypothetical protein [Pseudobutyrivibrio sp.]